MKKKLLISFSGGRTSAYMTYWLMFCWEERFKYDIIIVFANTGKEHEGTLEFVDRCEKEWNIPINWVEAVHYDENGKPWSEKGCQVKHRVVDFKTASRNGEPFEDLISLRGIPSTNAPFCSYQLKKQAIESFVKEIWGPQDFYTAIGIRIDEVDRVGEKWKENNLIYPLIQYNPTTKVQVVLWWKDQGFDLDIPEGLGNCDVCWKKSMNDLTDIAKKYPKRLDWWQQMTDKYGHFNPREIDLLPPYNFYRGNLSPRDIKRISKYKPDQLKLFVQEERLDGCSESCEAF